MFKFLVLSLVLSAIVAPSCCDLQAPEDEHLDPLNDPDTTSDASPKDQEKRTIFGPTIQNVAWAKHVAVHPGGGKRFLGFGPVDLRYAPVLRPPRLHLGYHYDRPRVHYHVKRPVQVVHSGWKPIVTRPAVAKPVHVDQVHLDPVPHVDHVHLDHIHQTVPLRVLPRPIAYPGLFEVTKPDLGVLPLGAIFPSPVLKEVPAPQLQPLPVALPHLHTIAHQHLAPAPHLHQVPAHLHNVGAEPHVHQVAQEHHLHQLPVTHLHPVQFPALHTTAHLHQVPVPAHLHQAPHLHQVPAPAHLHQAPHLHQVPAQAPHFHHLHQLSDNVQHLHQVPHLHQAHLHQLPDNEQHLHQVPAQAPHLHQVQLPQPVALPPGVSVEYHGNTNFVNLLRGQAPQAPPPPQPPQLPDHFHLDYPQIPQVPNRFPQVPNNPPQAPDDIPRGVFPDHNQPPLDSQVHFDESPRYQPAGEVSTQHFFRGPQAIEQLDQDGYTYPRPENFIQPGRTDVQVPAHLPRHPGFQSTQRREEGDEYQEGPEGVEERFQGPSYTEPIFKPSMQLEPPYKK